MTFDLTLIRRNSLKVLAAVIALTFLGAQPHSTKIVGVRDQLASLQRESGLTVGAFSWTVRSISFAKRKLAADTLLPPPVGRAQNGAVSPHGEQIAFEWRYPNSLSYESRLAVANRDGTNVREFREIKNPDTVCWSPDESKLAVYSEAQKGSPANGKLYLLDLPAHIVREIATGPALLTPQCWSPDDRQIVYEIPTSGAKTGENRIVVYEFVQKASRDLGRGAYPTWSPDGKRIALYDQNGYYLLHWPELDRTLLLTVKNATTGLLWSPESLFVAYGVCCQYPLLEGANARIYVRRLSDNSEDWVADIGHLLGDRNCNWIAPHPQSSR
jgi:hypothetical protein